MKLFFLCSKGQLDAQNSGYHSTYVLNNASVRSIYYFSSFRNCLKHAIETFSSDELNNLMIVKSKLKNFSAFKVFETLDSDEKFYPEVQLIWWKHVSDYLKV